jgi:DNA-binding beta-propeller fold protein YncE
VLLTVACTSPSIRIAVTSGTDGTTFVHDVGLVAADTHHLQAAMAGSTPAGSWLAYDGVTVFAAFRRGAGGSITRGHTDDGSLLDRVDFYRGQPVQLYPVFDGESVYAVTTEPTATGAHSRLHLLGFDLEALADPVPLCDASALGIAATRAANDLFVLCTGDLLVEVDRTLHTRVRVAPIVTTEGTGGTCGATDIALSSTGSVVFVLCADAGTLLYLDHLTLEPIRSLDVGPGGRWLGRAPDGQHVVVLRPDAREIVVLDVRRRVVTGRIATEGSPVAVVTDSNSRSAFVVTGGADGPGRLLKVDLASGTVVAAAATVPNPITVSAWPGEESPVMRWQVHAN